MPDSPWTTWAPGTRVVVRLRLSPDDAAAAGKPLTDVIGVVLETTATTLVLREDAGGSAPPHRGHGPRDDAPPLVSVPLDAIVAGKPVPPRPPRRPASRPD
ncbi:MAG: putative acetyltransferase [Cellulosimicrobium funkei]